MEIRLVRFKSNQTTTIGKLYIDNDFVCYTLEDAYNRTKIYSKTRIPAGSYRIELRKAGSLHEKYSKKFPTFHTGMLELQNVPGYQYIYIHIGNKPEDTKGCILVGNKLNEKDLLIQESTNAYVNLYPRLIHGLELREPLIITIIDSDRA